MWTYFFVLCLLTHGMEANPLEIDRNDIGVLKLDGKNGHIELPTTEIDGYRYYSQNSDARWNFDIPAGLYVMITSVYFDLEYSEDCMFDSLTMIEGGSENKICGIGPLVYISQGNELSLRFFSDESYEGQGFDMYYETLSKADVHGSHCNSSIIGGGSGEIFNAGEICYYRIQAIPGQFVKLDLKFLNFGSQSCEDESIKIYNGITNHGDLLKEICSGESNGPIEVSEEKLFIEYRRTFEIDEEEDRFSIGYSFGDDPLPTTLAPITTPSPVGGNSVCSRFYKKKLDSFIYEVPHYINNLECNLVVRNTYFKNHVIQVTFTDFELEEIDDCIFDSLKVFSGERSDSQSLGGPYCGMSLNGKTLVTYGNSLRLEFKTDRSFALYGFTAKIEFVPRTACVCQDENKVCVREGFEKKCLNGKVCNNNDCLNGGTCVSTVTSRQCYCRDGYTGEDCSERLGNAGFIHFKATPRNRVIRRDDNIVESCVVNTTDDQIVTYTWTINGDIIPPYRPKTGFGVLADKHLQIDRFSEALEGEYTCTATVGQNSAEIYFEYKIVENCQATISIKPEDQVKNIGDLVTFPCQASGAERVIWKRNGKELDIDREDRFSILIDTNILKIRDVKESDEGTYTCVALDANGCPTSRSATLTVTKIERYNEYCGITIYDNIGTGKISQGAESRKGDHPWQVTLVKADNMEPFCGGSVISTKYILTAAHCVTLGHFKQLEKVKLLFGGTNCKGEDAVAIRYPKRVIKHPDYGHGAKFNNDIALIELNQEIEYGQYIRPICLERKRYFDHVFFEERSLMSKASGIVAGCGKSAVPVRGQKKDAMKYVNLLYVSDEDCQAKWEGVETVSENMFCAGYEQRFRGDACSGDSGGPYVMTDERRWFQTGLVSFGRGCDNQFYTIFTHVGNYYDWIRGETQFDKEEVEDFLI